MIEFGIEYEEVMSPSEKDGDKKHYPMLFVSDVKEDDGLEIGEWTEVVAKIKKCSKTVREGDEGDKTYSCEYKVKGFVPMKKKETDFGAELEKMVGY